MPIDVGNCETYKDVLEQLGLEPKGDKLEEAYSVARYTVSSQDKGQGMACIDVGSCPGCDELLAAKFQYSSPEQLENYMFSCIEWESEW